MAQRVMVRRGLLERIDGKWTASLEIARTGMLPSRLKTSSFPRRSGAQGIGPANARDWVGDRSWGLECGGSGSGWIEAGDCAVERCGLGRWVPFVLVKAGS